MRRESIDGEKIFIIHDFLSPSQCEHHVERSEAIGYETFTIEGEVFHGFRDNARLIIDDVQLADVLWQSAAEHLPPIIESQSAAGFNPRFRYYRYTGSEAFAPHYDSSVRIGQLASKLTFLIYLTTVTKGGETRFFDAEMNVRYTVRPTVGKALVFEHEILHEGVAVEEGSKYVLRTDVMYG